MSIGLGINIQKKREQLAGPLREAIVDGKHPGLLLDFDDEYYLANGGKKSLDEVLTHSRAGNATMVASDGLIKWAPHNLLSYSEQFDNAYWSGYTRITTNSTTAPNGTNTADTFTTNGTVGSLSKNVASASGVPYTLSVYLKYTNNQWALLQLSDVGSTHRVRAWFDIQNGVVGTTATTGAGVVVSNSIENVGNGWFKCTLVATNPITSLYAYFPIVVIGDGSLSVGANGQSIYLWGAHLYRSDLGGMAPVPAGERSFPSASTYVPTTSSARYLPRVGHHVYNGFAWVNEGVLAESEARTNLVTYSNDFSTSWVATAISQTVDQIGPDGVSNSATTVTASGTQSYYYIGAGTNAGTATGSVFVKSGTANVIWLYWNSSASGGVAYFDLSDESVQAVAGSSQTPTNLQIQKFGDFYRVSASWVVTTGTTNFGFGSANAKGSITTTSGNSLIIYGAQFEAGPTPSSYIPTAGSTVTRAAETFTIPAANLPWPTETYGPELVTNGTFDSDTSGWTAEGLNTIASVGGELEITLNSAAFTGAIQYFSLEVGKSYLVSGQGRRGTSGSNFIVRIFDNTTTKQHTITTTSNEEFSFVFTASGTSGGIKILTVASNGSGTIYADNISVRELTRYPVSIQMNGRMTYADEATPAQSEFLRWYLDGSNSIRYFLRTDGSFTGTLRLSQAASGVSDTVDSSDVYSPGIFVPFNIAGRHGMTFVNGAVDGVASTANTTPTNLPDLSATDLNLAYDYMGTVERFRVWGLDLGDGGIELASAPSLEPSLSLTFDSSESSFVVDDWSA